MSAYATEINMEKKVVLNELQKKDAKEKLAKQYKEESRIVKGVFKNLESPGGSVEFPYRKFPQDPIMIYKLEDGKTYDVPLAVARHINITCNEKKHRYVVDKDGNKTQDVQPSRQRYQFLSTDFMG